VTFSPKNLATRKNVAQRGPQRKTGAGRSIGDNKLRIAEDSRGGEARSGGHAIWEGRWRYWHLTVERNFLGVLHPTIHTVVDHEDDKSVLQKPEKVLGRGGGSCSPKGCLFVAVACPSLHRTRWDRLGHARMRG